MESTILKLIALLGGLTITALFIYGVTIIDNSPPDEFNEVNWADTKKKAEQSTIDYFKNKKNMDVEIKIVSSSGEYAKREVYVEGHLIGNKQKKISSIVDTKTYKVKSVNGNTNETNYHILLNTSYTFEEIKAAIDEIINKAKEFETNVEKD
ncbi:hypothetical protein ACIQ1D_24475 [Lysinibacillus xylanilyticus]|uniref:hypothetical protein n=1 Tax=Lysinibacillus xylanilyticus TaxID=582475 RepID=UPI0037FE4CCB